MKRYPLIWFYWIFPNFWQGCHAPMPQAPTRAHGSQVGASTLESSPPEDNTSSPSNTPKDVGSITPQTATTQPSSPPTPPVSAAPSGCAGTSSSSSKDLVLFQGEALNPPNQNMLALGGAWTIDEVWDNGRLGLENLTQGRAFSFSNEGIYHGFKFTPASVNGVRKNFVLSGAEVYIQLQRSNPNAPLPTFGLRIIKPGENEGNGGAPTTTWMLDKATASSRFLPARDECTLVPMLTPKNFLDQQAVGNRLIWEMQSNWTVTDKLIIRKVVLKDFRFVP